jgi:K+-transporting ATPase KdpF subunit
MAGLQAGRNAGAPQMSVLPFLGLVLGLALGVYLLVALLFPEKFE